MKRAGCGAVSAPGPVYLGGSVATMQGGWPTPLASDACRAQAAPFRASKARFVAAVASGFGR